MTVSEVNDSKRDRTASRFFGTALLYCFTVTEEHNLTVFFFWLLYFSFWAAIFQVSMTMPNKIGSLKRSVMYYFKAAIKTANGYSLGYTCSYYFSRLSFLVYTVE